jgi:hypothetical protein
LLLGGRDLRDRRLVASSGGEGRDEDDGPHAVKPPWHPQFWMSMPRTHGRRHRGHEHRQHDRGHDVDAACLEALGHLLARLATVAGAIDDGVEARRQAPLQLGEMAVEIVLGQRRRPGMWPIS